MSNCFLVFGSRSLLLLKSLDTFAKMCKFEEVEKCKAIKTSFFLFIIVILISKNQNCKAQRFEGDERAWYNRTCSERLQFIQSHVSRPFNVEDVRIKFCCTSHLFKSSENLRLIEFQLVLPKLDRVGELSMARRRKSEMHQTVS